LQQAVMTVRGVDGSLLDVPLSVHPHARAEALASVAALAVRWLNGNFGRAPAELRAQLQVGACVARARIVVLLTRSWLGFSLGSPCACVAA
jgi:hypothetical protein